MLSSVAWIFYDYCLLSVPMMHLSHFFSVFFICVQKFVHTQVPATVTVGVVACLFKKLVQNYTENLSPRLYRNISHILYNLAGWIRCSQFFSFWMSLFEWKFYSCYQTNAFLLWRNITLLNNSAVYVHKFGQIEYFYAYDMTFGPTLTIVIFTKKDRVVC